MEQSIEIIDEAKLLSQEQIDLNAAVICRICLEKNQNNDKEMYDIFLDDAKPLFKKIMSCASVQIIKGDGLPISICQKCLTKLNIAWQFKQECESSDTRLRQLSTNPPISQLSETCNGKLDEKEMTTPTPESTEEFCNYNNNDDDDSIKRKNSRNGQKDSLKIHKCETCCKTFNRREYLTQHIRIHTGEKPYCCHICEKRFINSGHLTTHMRTHTGERPHTCTLCPKAFSTRQELHKHTMVHNGERPFVCSTCGKSFGSSSNLYSHLKHHTGEKNFTCEHCGKAFYTKQELKQHLVVHTGEKAFACEFCCKRFAQIAHLKRHLKLHVNNSNDYQHYPTTPS